MSCTQWRKLEKYFTADLSVFQNYRVQWNLLKHLRGSCSILKKKGALSLDAEDGPALMVTFYNAATHILNS